MPNHPGDSWGPDDERRVLALVDQVLELPVDAREGFLTDQCAGNPVMRKAADALLAACLRVEQGESFLSDSAAVYAEPVIRAVAAADAETLPQPAPQDRKSTRLNSSHG